MLFYWHHVSFSWAYRPPKKFSCRFRAISTNLVSTKIHSQTHLKSFCININNLSKKFTNEQCLKKLLENRPPQIIILFLSLKIPIISVSLSPTNHRLLWQRMINSPKLKWGWQFAIMVGHDLWMANNKPWFAIGGEQFTRCGWPWFATMMAIRN